MSLALTLALALAAPLPPLVAQASPHVIVNPDWLRRPTGEEFASLYPKAAVDQRIEGRATMQCKVDAEGALIDCALLTEDPAGEGFGPAALAMSSLFRMRPMTRDGQPVSGGIVRIPIRFVLPETVDTDT